MTSRVMRTASDMSDLPRLTTYYGALDDDALRDAAVECADAGEGGGDGPSYEVTLHRLTRRVKGPGYATRPESGVPDPVAWLGTACR